MVSNLKEGYTKFHDLETGSHENRNEIILRFDSSWKKILLKKGFNLKKSCKSVIICRYKISLYEISKISQFSYGPYFYLVSLFYCPFAFFCLPIDVILSRWINNLSFQSVITISEKINLFSGIKYFCK